MNPPRRFTAAEDKIIRAAHAGEISMRVAAARLRCGNDTLYRRMDELDLPRRRADSRRRKDKRRTA